MKMYRKPLYGFSFMLLIVMSLFVTVSVAQEETPYGGRLVAGFTSDVASINVAHQDYQWTVMGPIVWQLIYDQGWIFHEIVDTKATAKPPVPWFFKSWEVLEDGKIWIVYLAEDATWHDGVPVTAEDVAFTVDSLLRMPTWGAGLYINATEIIDEHTIKFIMNWPRAVPPMEWTPIIPKHVWEPYLDDLMAFPDKENTMIGSGPFKFKEWKKDEYWWLEANEDYWKGRPYIDELVLKVYPSTEALLLALKVGEIDMVGYGGVSHTAARELAKNPDINVVECEGIVMDHISVNVWEGKEDPLAQDVRVRKAIAHALDTDTVIDTILLGHGKKIDSWIYPELASHNPNLPQYDYNIAKANEILDEAGYLDFDGDGVREVPEDSPYYPFKFVFDLYCGTSSPEVREAEIYASSLKEIGMAITIKSLEFGSLTDVMFNPDTSMYDMAISGYDPGPTAEWIWELALSYYPGGWNSAGYANEKFDELWEAQAGEGDIEKRDQMWWEMEAILAEDLAYIYTIRADVMSPHRTDKFEGFVPAAGGLASWIHALTYSKVYSLEVVAETEISERVEELSSEIESISGDLADLSGRLEATSKDLADSIGDVSTSIDTMSTLVNVVRDELKSDITDAKEMLEKLQNTVGVFQTLLGITLIVTILSFITPFIRKS